MKEQLYYDEIFNFMKSIIIHYDKIAEQQNKNYSFESYDKHTWKYYINLSGNYHPQDEMMYVRSLDNQQQIEYTVENLKNHPKTKEAIYIGSEKFKKLCEVYPTQKDLIINILYPQDIDTCINAKQVEILTYDSSFLYDYEIDIIDRNIRKYFNYVWKRWYNSDYEYEKLMPFMFYHFFWQGLFLTVLKTRIQNIHTYRTHKTHVWRYLKGFGLSDYSDIFNKSQEMFLYRNIKYLLKHRGKHETMLLLAKKMFTTTVGLRNFQIREQIDRDTVRDDNLWVPEFFPEAVDVSKVEIYDDGSYSSNNSMSELQMKLINSGFDELSSLEDVYEKEQDIGKTRCNMVPTKCMEISQTNVDTKYERLLLTFLFDTLNQYMINNLYTKNIIVTDTYNNVMEMSGNDWIKVLPYIAYQSMGETLTHIPNRVTGRFAYKINLPELPKYFYVAGVKYMYKNYINMDEFVDDLSPFGEEQINMDFTEMIIKKFKGLIKHSRFNRSEGDKVRNEAFLNLHNYILYQPTEEVYGDKEKYIDAIPNYILTIINNYNNNDCNEFFNTVVNELCDLTNPELLQYFSEFNLNTEKYRRIKNLFIQLCSYRILFLDTEDKKKYYAILNKYESYHLRKLDSTLSNKFYLYEEEQINIESFKKDLFEIGDTINSYFDIVDLPIQMCTLNRNIHQTIESLTRQYMYDKPSVNMKLLNSTSNIGLTGPSITLRKMEG